MFIDKEMLDALSEEARKSPRLRMGMDMRASADDQSQRMLNAMEPGTIVPIHRHQNSAETFMLVRGKMRVVLYDDDKNIMEDAILSTDNGNYGIHIPIGVWHWVEILEPNTVTFEVKEGPYVPLLDEDIMK